jgi:hypothetical protein
MQENTYQSEEEETAMEVEGSAAVGHCFLARAEASVPHRPPRCAGHATLSNPRMTAMD